MQTPDSLLDAVVSELSNRLGDVVVSTWFRSARTVLVKDNVLYIAVPTTVERDTLKLRFTENVAEILKDISGKPIRPEYMTEEESLNFSRAHTESYYARYSFENFIVGPSNKFAHAASAAVSEAESSNYNPLFIYGPPGLGKTHLLFAIAGAVKKRHPNANVVYIKTETMINELIAAVRTNLFDEFRAKYRNADFLLVDDVQFLVGKAQLQEEFFNTFNHLHEAGKQIVLTADKPPRDIAIAERLQSRFEMGLLAGIESPDLETRIAMVDEKSRALGIVLKPEIVEYIASSITNNVREIEGAVLKIKAMHNFLGAELNLQMVQTAISDLIKARPGLHPTPKLILSETASYYNVPEEKLLSQDRSKEITAPRQIACYLMKEMIDMSFPAIGSFMGLHHTTVMYGVSTVAKKINEDHAFASEIKELRQSIENK